MVTQTHALETDIFTAAGKSDGGTALVKFFPTFL